MKLFARWNGFASVPSFKLFSFDTFFRLLKSNEIGNTSDSIEYLVKDTVKLFSLPRSMLSGGGG